MNTNQLWIGLSGTGSLAISGGRVDGQSSSIGFGALGTGFVTISGGTFSLANSIVIGNSGTGSLAISGNGYLENSAGLIGLRPNARGTVTVTSGSWANSSGVYVGYEGSGNSLSITGGGTVTSSQGWLGFGDSSNTNLGNNNTATVSGTGSIWNNSSNQYVGQYGSGNALSIDSGGAVASTGNGYIGLGSMSNVNSGNDNTVTVTGAGSTWSNALSFVVGDQGSGNALVIENGGSVSNASSWIGSGNSVFAANGNNNVVTVSGTGSNWTNSGNLVVGKYGSGNTLTIEDGALVKVGGTLSFSELGSSQQNFLRLDGGYIALFGEQAAYVGTLITAGHIQLWNGSTWVTATGGDLNIVQYQDSPAGEAAAEAATGYSGLGGYTVVTPQVVPEPGTAALIALGLGALLFRRRPRVYPKNVVDGWKGRKGRA